MAKKLKAFSFGPEDFQNLCRLCDALGWTGSKVVSELLAHAEVASRAQVRVELPSAVVEDMADVSA